MDDRSRDRFEMMRKFGQFSQMSAAIAARPAARLRLAGAPGLLSGGLLLLSCP